MAKSEKITFYVTTRKMQDTQDYVRDYQTEDNHDTLKAARNCIKEYNACFELKGREFEKVLQEVITKYRLSGSTYNSGKMDLSVKKRIIKTTII